MARDGILVEINLSSNATILGIEGRDHPLKLYLRHGVPIALSTDDEGVLRSEMTMEYLRAVRDHDLDYATLKRIARASLEHAFVDDETRRRLLHDHDRAVRAFEEAWGGAGRATHRAGISAARLRAAVRYGTCRIRGAGSDYRVNGDP
jgi:adenosine deaminase